MTCWKLHGMLSATLLFYRIWEEPEEKGMFRRYTMEDGRQNLVKEGYDQTVSLLIYKFVVRFIWTAGCHHLVLLDWGHD